MRHPLLIFQKSGSQDSHFSFRKKLVDNTTNYIFTMARFTLALVLFGVQVSAFVPQTRTFGLTCGPRTAACATELFGVVDFLKKAFGGRKLQEANNLSAEQDGPAKLIVTNPAPPPPEPDAKNILFAKKNVEEGN